MTQTTYFLGDALGSVRHLVDSAGQVTLARSYEPYGDVLTSAGSGVTSYSFTGEWRDGSGLVYLRARYYSSYLGQFVGSDPSHREQNLFQYGGSNPLMRADPSGECFIELVVGVPTFFPDSDPKCQAKRSGTRTPTPSRTKTPTPPKTATPRATATSTPTPTALYTAVYWQSMSEAQLAQFQQLQVGNTCAQYASAALLNMLYNGNVKGEWVKELAENARPAGVYKTPVIGATTPGQQVQLLQWLLGKDGVNDTSSSVVAKTGTKTDLVNYLGNANVLTIVTIGWSGAAPRLARTSDQDSTLGATRGLLHGEPFAAHALVLVAYDPVHVDYYGNSAEWGFVNSHWSGGSEIYWMSDSDFDSAWNYNIPFVGSNNVVVVTKGP